MIKRKKIIKIRKNPARSDDVHLHYNIKISLESGELKWLVKLITYYNQGFVCEDCDHNYDSCNCEKCDDCDQRRCICRFLGDDSKPKDRIRIRKIVWEFVRYVFKSDIPYEYEHITPSKDFIKLLVSDGAISSSEGAFLKSLKPSSKFPKYTSLMKRLFEID